jgi:ribosome-binding protein aMBF1 (putative translation factor)
MLALVKKPRMEIALHGEDVSELLAWIAKKYDVTVLTDDPSEDSVPIENTEYWRVMEKNRIGNLLAAARLKAGLTQSQLAEKVGIRQNMVSDFEHGRRTCSHDMARRLSQALEVREEMFQYGGEARESSEK